MKLTQYCILLLFIFTLLIPGVAQVPQVPSSIKIADVQLRINSGARAKIQKDVNAIRASEKYFRIKLDLVNLYFPIIERVLKEEGVPDDIKYLSIQESALQSDAVSSANAVGYWQFKDFTAREVGLRVDGKVDERKNIVSATHGAAKYVKRNNHFFDNWIYAVNAYMTGPGGAKRYVDKRNFGTGKLDITENTHWYVLRFIAHVIAFKDEVGDPHSQGLKLVEYTKGANKDLDDIARQFNVDKDLVKEYNKWLSHGKVPDDKIYTVIIPVTGKVPKMDDEHPPLARNIKEPDTKIYPETLTDNLKNQRAIPVKINGLEAVMAGKKDNLVTLALKADISSRRLEKFNDLEPGDQIKAGEIYYTQKKRNRSPIRYHVAKPGESLWDISQKYGVKLKKLAKKNRMEEDDQVKVGRVMWLRKKRPKNTPVEYHKLKTPAVPKEELIVRDTKPADETPKVTTKVTEVPTKSEPPVKTETPVVRENKPVTKPVEKKPEPEPTIVYRYHEVQAGESLWRIANHYQVSVEEIQQWNEMGANSTLSPGQKLRLRADKISEIKEEAPKVLETPATPKSSEKYHTVQAGESLWSISTKYNVTLDDLKKWNRLNNTSLSVGQKLVIHQSAMNESKAENSALPSYHEVQAGESLWAIANKYNVTVENLSLWNDLPQNAPLRIGQKLALNGSTSTVNAAKPKAHYHEVQSGESLWSIAQRYEVSIEELQRWNDLSKNAILSPGQNLTIANGKSSSSKPQFVTYIVRGGDSLYKIARQYNTTVEEIMSLNNLSSSSLSVGDELKVKQQ